MQTIPTVEGLPTSPAPIPAATIAEAGRLIFLSGRVAQNPDGTIFDGDAYTQTRQILEDSAAILEDVGSSMGNVLRVGVIVTAAEHFPGVNQAWVETWPDENKRPARTSLIGGLLAKGAVVELEVTAEGPRG